MEDKSLKRKEQPATDSELGLPPAKKRKITPTQDGIQEETENSLEPEVLNQQNPQTKVKVEDESSPTNLKKNPLSSSLPEALNQQNPKTKPKLVRANTQDIVQNNRNELTKSGHLKKGKESPMTSHARHLAMPKENFDVKEAKDMLVVSALSQEASRNFATNFHKKITNDDWSINKYDINSTDKAILESKVVRSQKDNHADFIQSVFENKRPSHVIAVIEGDGDPLPKSFVFKDTADREHTYKLQDERIQGKKANGGKDAKQNMHFYVREDMEGAITISEQDIQRSKKEKFTVGKISFATENGTKYSVLVPHIPNKFIGNEGKDKDTHDAFETFAAEQKKATVETEESIEIEDSMEIEGAVKIEKAEELEETSKSEEMEVEKEKEIVIGYIGDTNYSDLRGERTVASLGGYSDEKFLSVPSSGAQKTTYFMQAVPLATNDDEPSFAMQQPITLNLIDLNSEESKIATDHPSIQTGIFLTDRIAGRKLSKEEVASDEIALTQDVKNLSTPTDEKLKTTTNAGTSDFQRSLDRLPESVSNALQTPHSHTPAKQKPPLPRQNATTNEATLKSADNVVQTKAEEETKMEVENPRGFRPTL